ncbi:MAG: hypothetical protein ITG02_04785 [Patulibacter sp.]|nr:hypothetical protein [Patulibacter sp.]
MPSLRLYPLLVTGAACLALAACGDDDPASTQAGVPAQTEAAPAETAPSQAPATTAPDGSTSEESDAPAAGGSGASDEATKVRQALITVQEAFAAKDGKKACAHMVGIPKKTDPKRPGLSCESLSQGPKSTLSEENRKIAANAKVTIDGNKATAELGPGVPLELRKVDGRWRVDYSNLTGGAPSPR